MKLQVNKYTTIKKVFFTDDTIHEFFKHGIKQPYKQFTGVLNKCAVVGFVCLNDNSVYNLKELTT